MDSTDSFINVFRWIFLLYKIIVSIEQKNLFIQRKFLEQLSEKYNIRSPKDWGRVTKNQVIIIKQLFTIIFRLQRKEVKILLNILKEVFSNLFLLYFQVPLFSYQNQAFKNINLSENGSIYVMTGQILPIKGNFLKILHKTTTSTTLEIGEK